MRISRSLLIRSLLEENSSHTITSNSIWLKIIHCMFRIQGIGSISSGMGMCYIEINIKSRRFARSILQKSCKRSDRGNHSKKEFLPTEGGEVGVSTVIQLVNLNRG